MNVKRNQYTHALLVLLPIGNTIEQSIASKQVL